MTDPRQIIRDRAAARGLSLSSLSVLAGRNAHLPLAIRCCGPRAASPTTSASTSRWRSTSTRRRSARACRGCRRSAALGTVEGRGEQVPARHRRLREVRGGAGGDLSRVRQGPLSRRARPDRHDDSDRHDPELDQARRESSRSCAVAADPAQCGDVATEGATIRDLWPDDQRVPAGVPVLAFLNADDRERERMIRKARG